MLILSLCEIEKVLINFNVEFSRNKFMTLCERIAEQGWGAIVNRQILLRPTKNRKVWRTMMNHILKGRSTKKKVGELMATFWSNMGMRPKFMRLLWRQSLFPSIFTKLLKMPSHTRPNWQKNGSSNMAEMFHYIILTWFLLINICFGYSNNLWEADLQRWQSFFIYFYNMFALYKV